jgi:hypothetical protein
MDAVARENVRIVPAKGGWQVISAKTPTSRVFKTKRDAISYALAAVRSSRVGPKVPRVTSARAVSGGGVKKNRTVRKSSAKSRSSKDEESPLARLVEQAQVEHDRDATTDDAFRQLIDKAAKANEAALDRLAQ